MPTSNSRTTQATSHDSPTGADAATGVGHSEPLAVAQGGPAKPVHRRHRRRSVWPILLLLAAMVGGGVGGWWWWTSRDKETRVERALFTVHRADLPIVITEGGNIKALHSEIIKSKVEGRATIISLVPEGTRITEEDVKKAKVLVEMDSAELRERLTQQEITFANAQASFTAAKEAFAINKSEGESKTKNGELNVKFGRMDLEHYVGDALCNDALTNKVDLLKLSAQLHEAALDHRKAVEASTAAALKDIKHSLAEPPDAKFDPSRIKGKGQPPPPPKPAAANEKSLAGVTEPSTSHERLGGLARQTGRKLDADIELSIERFKRASDKLIWTARLEKKGFVSHNELEADQLALKSSLIDLQQALSARELFLRYEFPKKAEEYLSIYRERGRELERIRARTRASAAQAEAKLRSNEATFLVQKHRLEKIQKQIEYCTIHATKPGLVVYATSGHWRNRTPIEEGSTVHERQQLIHLPDVSALAVDVKVHESVVDKVKIGLKARIRIDAFKDLLLKGQVLKVGVLPDSQSWWLNPDLKQYQTEVSIEGAHTHLKPGMSAEVEILVAVRKAVLQVPVQAVSTRGGKSVVYLVASDSEEPREVVLGDSNDKFVEVRKGVSEGDRILLEAPQAITADDEEEQREPADGPKAKGKPRARPATRPKGPPGKQPAGTAPGKARRKPPKGKRPPRTKAPARKPA